MNRFLKIWLTGISLFIISESHIMSQPDEYNVEIFNIEDGLSQSYTNVIFQDSKGFLWIGTKNGINKFNGYTFENYRNEPNDSGSLINNHITAIAEDRNGIIWIGTREGISKYDRKNDRFTNYFHDTQDDNSLSDNEVYSLMIDRENVLWLKSRFYLEKFDTASDNFIHYKHYNSVFPAISTEKCFPLLQGDNGIIFIGTKDGLQIFKPDDESFLRFFYQRGNVSCISNDFIKCIESDNKGLIWIGTEDGLNAFNPKNNQFKTYRFDAKGEAVNQINDILIDSEGITWIATNNGLVYFNKYTGFYRILKELDGINGPVNITTVFSILEDKSKILWLTTPEGLIKIDKKPRKFHIISEMRDNDKYKMKLNVTSLLLDNKNNLWIGTYGGGIKLLQNVFKGSLLYVNSGNNMLSRLKDLTVYSMLQDKEGIIWIGTDNGLFIFNPKLNNLKEFCKQSTVIPCNIFENKKVYSIMEDAEGDIWFGSSRGVHVYDRKYEIVRSIYQIQNVSIVEIENAYTLFQDHKGIIWIGCDEGLIKYDKNKNIYFHYGKEPSSKPFNIPGGTVYCIHEGTDNALWLGTSYGLQVFHPDSGGIAIYTTNNLLPDNLIYSIEHDVRGDLWLGTNHGISHFSPKTGVVRNFNLQDGLQGYEYNIGVSCIDTNGRIYFGGVQGLNYFYPDSMTFNLHIPPVEITTLEIFGGKTSRRYNIEDRDEIEIPYGKFTFNIYFAALDFTYPERNQYAYKMIRGNDEGEWIYIGNHDYASFSNISTGEYMFHVIGSNSDNTWNYDGKKIRIIIKPPFWQTTLAYISFGLMALVIINLFLRFRTKSLRRANRILKEKEQASIQIAKQKEELSLQNKNIRDSINYARRIQQAILPSEKVFKTYLPDSFIYYQPKDIVSGDFYWIQEIQEKIFLAAVDCTGHGVPGAFMSIIGYELFRRLRAFRNFDDPARILYKLNEDFGEIFKDIQNVSLKDGMDIALCIIDKYAKHIKFAGAFSPFYIVRDDKVIEIKGERYSVGVDGLNLEKPQFITHHIDMLPDDFYYVFSDGYADQFGGPEGKKYKFRRFRHLLLSVCHQPFEVQKYLLEESLEEWKGEHEQVDDIMVIGFKVRT